MNLKTTVEAKYVSVNTYTKTLLLQVFTFLTKLKLFCLTDALSSFRLYVIKYFISSNSILENV